MKLHCRTLDSFPSTGNVLTGQICYLLQFCRKKLFKEPLFKLKWSFHSVFHMEKSSCGVRYSMSTSSNSSVLFFSVNSH